MARLNIPHLDINIINRCSLSCLRCNRMAKLPQPEYPLDHLLEDLRILAKYLHAAEARIVGGEPLLHPQLERVLAEVQAMGLATRLILVTNGLLPDRVTPAILGLLDHVDVSIYAITPMAPLEALQARAAAIGKRVVLSPRKEFFRTWHAPGHSTEATAVTYKTCPLKDCVEYREGHIARCSSSVMINRLQGAPFADSERVVDTPLFGHDLWRRLGFNSPQFACRNCRGKTAPEAWSQEPDLEKWKLANDIP